jgi:hypothetical protein
MFLLAEIHNVSPYHDHGAGPSVAAIAFVVIGAIAGVLVYKLADLVTLRVRRSLQDRRAERRREHGQATAERRARALMSELCPQGWRAQITLFAPGDELPIGAPDGDWARVALDWAELDPDRGGPAVVRRVWAATISDALDAMVADRRTDETLEQIEQGAAADGAEWPDL